MRLDLQQPPSALREQPSLQRIAAARAETPLRPAGGHDHALLLRRAQSDAPLARTLARAVQQRAATAAADPHGMVTALVARAPAPSHAAAAGRIAFIRVWTDVEMDVGSTSSPEDLYESFVRSAEAAQRDPELYSAVSDMYGQIDDLIAAYLDGVPIAQMAANAGF